MSIAEIHGPETDQDTIFVGNFLGDYDRVVEVDGGITDCGKGILTQVTYHRTISHLLEESGHLIPRNSDGTIEVLDPNNYYKNGREKLSIKFNRRLSGIMRLLHISPRSSAD